jgi:hypothetical protein
MPCHGQRKFNRGARDFDLPTIETAAHRSTDPSMIGAPVDLGLSLPGSHPVIRRYTGVAVTQSFMGSADGAHCSDFDSPTIDTGSRITSPVFLTGRMSSPRPA